MKFDRNIKRSLKTLVLATTIIWGSLFSSKALADENFGFRFSIIIEIGYVS